MQIVFFVLYVQAYQHLSIYGKIPEQQLTTKTWNTPVQTTCLWNEYVNWYGTVSDIYVKDFTSYSKFFLPVRNCLFVQYNVQFYRYMHFKNSYLSNSQYELGINRSTLYGLKTKNGEDVKELKLFLKCTCIVIEVMKMWLWSRDNVWVLGKARTTTNTWRDNSKSKSQFDFFIEPF